MKHVCTQCSYISTYTFVVALICIKQEYACLQRLRTLYTILLGLRSRVLSERIKQEHCAFLEWTNSACCMVVWWDTVSLSQANNTRFLVEITTLNSIFKNYLTVINYKWHDHKYAQNCLGTESLCEYHCRSLYLNLLSMHGFVFNIWHWLRGLGVWGYGWWVVRMHIINILINSL